MSHKEQKPCPCGGAAKNEGCQYKKRNGNLIEMKSFQFELKEISEAGMFEGFLATNGNVDNGNDRFIHGVWKRTTTIQPGKRFPFLDSHNLERQTGSFTAVEKKEGLFITGKLNLTLIDANGTKLFAVPDAWKQYALMKDGDLNTLSVGYRPTEKGYRYITENNKTVREITEARLFEGSAIPVPMNEMAIITDIKKMDGLSHESIIDYLMKYGDVKLWERIMEIKGYDPDLLTIGPGPEKNQTEPILIDNDGSIHGFNEKFWNKYEKLHHEWR